MRGAEAIGPLQFDIGENAPFVNFTFEGSP